MKSWQVITDCGTYFTAGRTAQIALSEFECPKGEAIIGILRHEMIVHLSGFRSVGGMACVLMRFHDPTPVYPPAKIDTGLTPKLGRKRKPKKDKSSPANSEEPTQSNSSDAERVT